MGDDPGISPSTISRRLFLAACAPFAASCARTKAVPSGPQPVSIPLERFPSGVRVTVSVEGHPVEVLRSAAGVTARSLLCTHQGCEVAWSDAAQAYLCPCHEGKYDAEGRPKEGPPPAPLRTLPARVDGAALLVGPF
jgi:Rieske Fe-S protein